MYRHLSPGVVVKNYRRALSAGAACKKTSCRTLCGSFQPFTSVHTNPTPDLTLTLIPTLWGARGRQGQSRGSVASFGGVFPKRARAAENPASRNKTSVLQDVLCRPRLHLGRAKILGSSMGYTGSLSNFTYIPRDLSLLAWSEHHVKQDVCVFPVSLLACGTATRSIVLVWSPRGLIFVLTSEKLPPFEARRSSFAQRPCSTPRS